jgi:hypothetical protein
MISRRKEKYPLSPSLLQYLHHFGRLAEIPIVYDDLLRFDTALPYENPSGRETLWLTVAYAPEVMRELQPKLTRIYAMLKIGGDLSRTDHLSVERIDFGDFGNSRPFRVRIINRFNGNADHYYVKYADASRLYGLELEHLLSPFRINYLVRENTLIEEHIAGVPGDEFIRVYLGREDVNKVRMAKEFVKFAERCYLRLLGDMRAVNYIVDITPDSRRCNTGCVRSTSTSSATKNASRFTVHTFSRTTNRSTSWFAGTSMSRPSCSTARRSVPRPRGGSMWPADVTAHCSRRCARPRSPRRSM